jgi:hypothetical protein
MVAFPIEDRAMHVAPLVALVPRLPPAGNDDPADRLFLFGAEDF